MVRNGPDGHGECGFVNARWRVDRDEIVGPVEMKRAVRIAEPVRGPRGTVQYTMMPVTAGVVSVTREQIFGNETVVRHKS